MKRHRHTPEQFVRKLREGDRLLNEGRDFAEVLSHLEVSESSWNRWRARYGAMKVNEARRLRELEVGCGRSRGIRRSHSRVRETCSAHQRRRSQTCAFAASHRVVLRW